MNPTKFPNGKESRRTEKGSRTKKTQIERSEKAGRKKTKKFIPRGGVFVTI
jgi:hypothetical protein